MKIKENTKKNVLSGTLGAAAGVAGAMGASELSDILKGDEEDVFEDDEDVVAQDVTEDEEEEIEVNEDDIISDVVAQNEDLDEIVPVDSGGMGQIQPEGNQIAMVDVNPDEIAQEIIAEPLDDEMLLANHGTEDGAIGEDIEALFEEEEGTDPESVSGEVAETEMENIDVEGEPDGLEDEVDEDFADTGDEPMDDMVDDIG